ncbi:MAG: helix-turn-helix domain-containing protein [Candidatus Riflebacteria bacterium]|nr:helix-turn-helix domain-containing protein [Candidatus Riflebacteria bacterium]
MSEPRRLLTVQETAAILHMNPEVVRRWLRNGTLKGTKVGSDWRVAEATIEAFLNKAEPVAVDPATQGPKMCVKFPKWLEFSGLPEKLNDLLGPSGWPIFKKLVELDFEHEEATAPKIPIDLPSLCRRVGYPEALVLKTIAGLGKHGYLTLDPRRPHPAWVKIPTPVKTPVSILDIPFAEGGIKGAPEKACESRCLRRYLL